MPHADPGQPTFPLRYEEWTWEGTVNDEPATLTMRGWTNKDGSFVGSGVCTQLGRPPRHVAGGIFALWWPMAYGMRLWECPPGKNPCYAWYGDTSWQTPPTFCAHRGFIELYTAGQEPTFKFCRTRQTPLPPPAPGPVRPLPVATQHLADIPDYPGIGAMPGLAEQLAGMLSPEHYEVVQGFDRDEDTPCFMGSQGNMLCAGRSSGWVKSELALAVSPQGRVDVLTFKRDVNFAPSRGTTPTTPPTPLPSPTT